MNTLTDVQRDALLAWQKHRVVVVRACPGAGKTRVFVEAIRQEMAALGLGRRGLAALSFTNVAQDEVRKRIGGRLISPHFVGTLDAFLWRFVVVPFAHLVGVRAGGPTLIAAKLAETLSRPAFQYGGPTESAPLMQCDLRPDNSGSLEVHIKGAPPDTRKNAARAALAAKKRFWAASGKLTHADAQYIAAEILRGTHGALVRTLLARRFSAILVDECQDTRGYMADTLVAITNAIDLRIFAVGDPDQSIFGFGGGDKTVLTRIASTHDAVVHDLNETHRCSRRIAKVASSLSRRRADISPRPTMDDGAALLVIHNHPYTQPTLNDIIPALERAGVWPATGDKAILARKWTTLSKLRGAAMGDCPLSSRIARRTADAAACLGEGDPRAAFSIVSHALADLLEVNPDADGLRAAGFDRGRWRRVVYGILREATCDNLSGETWGAWRTRVRSAYETAVAGLNRTGKLGPHFKKGKDEDEEKLRPSPTNTMSDSSLASAFEVVHSVKGREFDAVLFYVPKPHAAHAKCPSKEWWGSSTDSEEQEVAFVAVSRAKTVLALAVHKDTAESLRREQPDFVALFDEVRLESGERQRVRRSRATGPDGGPSVD